MPAQAALEQLNIRTPKKLAQELAALAKVEHVAKIDMARQLLREGIARRKQDVALKLYEEGQVSKSRAAEIAGLSLWEFAELVEGVSELLIWYPILSKRKRNTRVREGR